MLKSTYKPVAAPSPLPPGWTEHKAPTGHSYYYNASAQQSTYTRPVGDVSQPTQYLETRSSHSNSTGLLPQSDFHGQGSSHQTGRGQQVYSRDFHRNTPNGFGQGDARHRPQPTDRPKSKRTIPGCEPWVLVKTKLGRRFVYHPQQNESFWKFPPDVMKAVVECDRAEREKRTQEDRKNVDGDTEHTSQHALPAPSTAVTGPLPLTTQKPPDNPPYESDEYEEVEVTDGDEDEDEDEEVIAKRQKTGSNDSEKPVEFNEDDIAYQLAAMGQDYGLDPGEYGDLQGQDLEEGAEGLPLSEEEASALFQDMLDDHHINPYTPWEKLIEDGHIVADDRYTVLPNMKARKEVWGNWSRDRIQRLKDQREKEERKDPRIPYLAFLQSKATPKLYWPEFRRKYMKEPEMRNTKLSEKEREKWYRDYINRLKLPESTLKSDLVSMLKSMPLHALNRSTSMAALPPAMLTDIRYLSLRPSVRDPLIETHITTLPAAPDTSDAGIEEEEALAKQKQERERREEALAERQLQVQREKRRAREALEYSKGRIREGEQEVQRALKVGKEGLLGYLEKEEQPPPLPLDSE
ncbi:MAG: hypothetical protein Q9177_002841 [Variospora cf. flavescens]